MVTSEATLLNNEAILHRSLHGRLTHQLFDIVSASPADRAIRVGIWTNAQVEYPRKEDLLADHSLLASHQSNVSTAVRVARSPVVAWLNAKGYKIHDDGADSPLVRADVPAAAIPLLSDIPSVAIVDADADLHPQSLYAWYTTVRADKATLLSNGGIKVCNLTSGHPVDYTNLPGTTVEFPNAPPGPPATIAHDTATTAIIRNNGPSGLTMTTAASDYMNQNGFSPFLGMNWCMQNGAVVADWTNAAGTGAPSDTNNQDWQFDWYAKQSPFPLTVACSGDYNALGNDAVWNRGYNYLVVGGSDDKGTTTLSDDTIWDRGLYGGQPGVGSSWRNPTSLHGDRELPELVAPAENIGLNITGFGDPFSGTSASAPMVTGAAALVIARDTSFGGWPEMSRAVITAASLFSVDSQIFSLPVWDQNHDIQDMKQGAGLLNANYATILAAPAVLTQPGSVAVSKGRWRKTVTFASDFNSLGWSFDIYNIRADVAGRLRVVIAFDSNVASCDQAGTCTGDALDGDIDLYIKNPNGSIACPSTTYDSSWEMCDIPVAAGQTFTAQLANPNHSFSKPSTYFGIAWLNYDPNTL